MKTITKDSDKELIECFYDILKFKVDKGQEPTRIDKWLQSRIEYSTRNKIQLAIDAGLLTVNGKGVNSNYKVKPGDQIVFMKMTSKEKKEITPENIPLDVVYEDEQVLLINKPVNMVVHPAIGNHSGTLVQAVLYHLQKEKIEIAEEDLPRYGLVHRIDKNTSGLIVFAKTPFASQHLSRQFYYHSVKRKYIALVWGNVIENTGTIRTYIGRDEKNRKKFTNYKEADEMGKESITHFTVLERFFYVTLIECQLETGRTHQIRVHLQHIGHPLFNDPEYGGNYIVKGTIFSKYKQFVDNCFQICPRVALHAKTLGFVHPTTHKNMHFDSVLPNDMQLVIEKWRNYVTHIKKETKKSLDIPLSH